MRQDTKDFGYRLLSMFLSWVLFIIAILLVAKRGEGQEIPFNAVIVKHPYATTPQQQVYLRQGIERIRETGVNLKLRKLKVVGDTVKQNSTKQYTKRLAVWRNLAHYKGWCNDNTICFMLLPPITDGVSSFGGGVSSGECQTSGTSYAIARAFNSAGLSRALTSVTSISHELGHTLGAEHINTKTIMHPNALAFGEIRLPWAKFSRELIDLCLLEEKVRKISLFGYSIRRSLKSKIEEPLYD